MPMFPNVLRAMQSIQRGTEEVLENMANVEGLKPRDGVLLSQCIDTLKNILEETNAYTDALPTYVQPWNKAKDDVATGDPE